MPMATGVTEANFVDGKWSRTSTPDDPETQKRMRKARSLLWKELGEYKIWACMYMQYKLKKKQITKKHEQKKLISVKREEAKNVYIYTLQGCNFSAEKQISADLKVKLVIPEISEAP